MALTAAQIAAIKKQAPKNIATRAALQKTKISNVQAGAAGEKIRQGVAPRYRGVAPGTNAMSPSAKATGKSQAQKNADLEAQRRFAKGEKPLATKKRVGTKAEYKALGKEINTKAELHKKATEIAKKKPAVTTATATTPKKDLMPYDSSKPAEKATMPNKDVKPAGKQNMSTKPASKSASTTAKVRVGSGVASQGELSTAEEVNRYKAAVAAGKSKGEAVRIAKAGSTGAKATIGAASTGTKASSAGAKAAAGAASTAAKKAGFGKILGAVARGAKAPFTPTGIAATVALQAAGPLFENLNKGAKTGTAVSNKTAGKGATTGFVEGAKSGNGKGTGSAPWGVKAAAPTKPTETPTGTSGKYRVSSGDTLSGIASRAGVTLAELKAANPQLDGKGIFRNTGVNIPKSGKMPTGGYTGAVPYKAPTKAKTTPTKPKVVTKPVTKPTVTPTVSSKKYPTAQ